MYRRLWANALGLVVAHSTHYWTEYHAQTTSGEYCVGQHGLPLDGFWSMATVFADGSVSWHAAKRPNALRWIFWDFDNILTNKVCIRHLVYNLVIKRVRDWIKAQLNDLKLQHSITNLTNAEVSARIPMTEDDIIKAIHREHYFGLVECDNNVPNHFTEKFSEISPIF